MTIHLYPLPILKDNYAWMVIDTNTHSAILVDPGEAAPIRQYLVEQSLTLKAILITHHHWDHTNGLITLKQAYDIPVFGPLNDAVEGITHAVQEEDEVQIPNFPVTFRILDIPGHTQGHIAYQGTNAVFCGDTLFSAGCGRLFEGTAEQLFHSLQKLKALPPNTQVCCGHEYTQNNLRFAQIIEPSNIKIQARIEKVNLLRTAGKPSLPSILQEEIETNPFLRCHQPIIKENVERHFQQRLDTPVEVFRWLRKWKDSFI